jgi:uncharacterized membrane protein
MESRAKLLGHAFHPMLIVFPLGLLATSLSANSTGSFSRCVRRSDVSGAVQCAPALSILANPVSNSCNASTLVGLTR